MSLTHSGCREMLIKALPFINIHLFMSLSLFSTNTNMFCTCANLSFTFRIILQAQISFPPNLSRYHSSVAWL